MDDEIILTTFLILSFLTTVFIGKFKWSLASFGIFSIFQGILIYRLNFPLLALIHFVTVPIIVLCYFLLSEKLINQYRYNIDFSFKIDIYSVLFGLVGTVTAYLLLIGIITNEFLLPTIEVQGKELGSLLNLIEPHKDKFVLMGIFIFSIFGLILTSINKDNKDVK